MKDKFARFFRAQTITPEKWKGHATLPESETENDLENIVGEHQAPLCCELRGKTVYEYIVDRIDDDVDQDVRTEFESHFRRCANCFGSFLRLQRILDLVSRSEDLLNDARISSRSESARRNGIKWDSRSEIN